MSIGAGKRSRTPDLLITNELLYQLSYSGVALHYSKSLCASGRQQAIEGLGKGAQPEALSLWAGCARPLALMLLVCHGQLQVVPTIQSELMGTDWGV